MSVDERSKARRVPSEAAIVCLKRLALFAPPLCIDGRRLRLLFRGLVYAVERGKAQRPNKQRRLMVKLTIPGKRGSEDNEIHAFDHIFIKLPKLSEMNICPNQRILNTV